MDAQRTQPSATPNGGIESQMHTSSPQPEHSEGQVARTLEQQTAKLPSDTWLWAAVGSMALSFSLQVMGKRKTSLFFGQWAPTFLIIGLYNKLVKVAGSH